MKMYNADTLPEYQCNLKKIRLKMLGIVISVLLRK